ncbi:hypothetical protein [Oceanobacillus halophilus]|uniref:Uncharacterized protein n=1 Tax=Oceanobacillus halophilus TaxID=930130 RepID=A0A495A3A1_9BACI|nr:hypothetical protein [Oceanobacillus halophilus]RKQ33993.1 hypothetical protein D8M06_09240 [Oceanobacillus halophilus]
MSLDQLAKKRWLTIPSNTRKKVEENVYCGNCGVTTIVNYEVDSSNFRVFLEGYCEKCGSKVMRVVG